MVEMIVALPLPLVVVVVVVVVVAEVEEVVLLSPVLSVAAAQVPAQTRVTMLVSRAVNIIITTTTSSNSSFCSTITTPTAAAAARGRTRTNTTTRRSIVLWYAASVTAAPGMSVLSQGQFFIYENTVKPKFKDCTWHFGLNIIILV